MMLVRIQIRVSDEWNANNGYLIDIYNTQPLFTYDAVCEGNLYVWFLVLNMERLCKNSFEEMQLDFLKVDPVPNFEHIQIKLFLCFVPWTETTLQMDEWK